ncbi:hypothetical protein RHMOL_Rhmol06G0169700 [Rhododendron molle]|uniref:Uncharacterized protein n=1 Tax=Rhododendron molle TaxID=49168 RepID=A0ACC0ND28_RHOML|nr:hypothetical protein RHMOL_Rhmol06G0169700 [Rhododendron molle]
MIVPLLDFFRGKSVGGDDSLVGECCTLRNIEVLKNPPSSFVREKTSDSNKQPLVRIESDVASVNTTALQEQFLKQAFLQSSILAFSSDSIESVAK